jgi:hypothetical protein
MNYGGRVKALLIDPFAKSVEAILIPEDEVASLIELRRLVKEDTLDFAYLKDLRITIAVGDHSALADPPLASFQVEGLAGRLYGRAVVLGYDAAGASVSAKLSVEQMHELISFP